MYPFPMLYNPRVCGIMAWRSTYLLASKTTLLSVNYTIKSPCNDKLNLSGSFGFLVPSAFGGHFACTLFHETNVNFLQRLFITTPRKKNVKFLKMGKKNCLLPDVYTLFQIIPIFVRTVFISLNCYMARHVILSTDNQMERQLMPSPFPSGKNQFRNSL